jgi:hypothetical protein
MEVPVEDDEERGWAARAAPMKPMSRGESLLEEV